MPGKEIFDYHPDSIPVPVGLFKNASGVRPEAEPGKPAPPLVQVYVKAKTRGQIVGMAEGDLYLIEGERTFAENYFKAASAVVPGGHRHRPGGLLQHLPGRGDQLPGPGSCSWPGTPAST